MPFNYLSNLDALVSVLASHNTTTASPNLSGSLSSSVVTIEDRDWEVQQLRVSDVPGVFVRIANSEEEFASLGNTGPAGNRKFKEVHYEILGVYKKDGMTQENSDLARMAYQLAANIEGVLQANVTLTNTALWANPERSDFTPSFQHQGAWLKGVLTRVRARYFFR